MPPTCPVSPRDPRPASLRLSRILEGISLWLAVLLLLFVHPIYAEASEGAGERGIVGEIRERAVDCKEYAKAKNEGLKMSGRVWSRFPSALPRYPQVATMAPLLQALSLLGLMFSAAIGLLKKSALV